MNFSLADKKLGIIGLGNMGQSVLKALLKSQTLKEDQIYVHTRSEGKIKKILSRYKVQQTETAEQLVDQCDMILFSVQPQDLLELLEPLRGAFTSEKVAMSMAPGISLRTLRKYLPEPSLVRIMPSAPALVSRGVIHFCIPESDMILEKLVKKLFSPLGYVVSTEEGEEFSALTISSASGAPFVLEIMKYWQDWIQEYGFEPEIAKKIVVETFLGAALLAEENEETTFHQLTERLASKKGVTDAGLLSLRELELEGILRMSFNKALMRDHEIGKENS